MHFFSNPIRKGIAEELPFPNSSVDLLTASSAAHWFDQPRFQAEANRVLKPQRCIALVDFTFANTRLHYQDCGERLTQIFKEVGASLHEGFQNLPLLPMLYAWICSSSNALPDWMRIISV